MRNIYSIVILLVLYSSSLSSQRMNHLRGDLLVQLNAATSPDRLAEKYGFVQKQRSELKSVECLSSTLNIWKFNFNSISVSEYQLLSLIQADKDVVYAQFNHFIKMRSTIPNDPLFTSQWQYINTGINGGVLNADLDIDLAWDVTTGGVTHLGDTIVVCVIDGGIDEGHQDFEDNLWVNHFEIANNNIDDDGNGYIDDVRGWNVAGGNDNVNGGNHGTAVAGIIGAKGNNNLGVTGINWNVKVMVVKHSNSALESEVIAAYEFPLKQRKDYNESNGAKGAFVVATNASFGIDGGMAVDAPLWCALYDTLGHYGILNCGATVNANENVEDYGDLPTTCPSDYLVSVTNIRKNDMKETNAGYGDVSIDLGAYGTSVYSTSIGNNYNTFGGTSGATPQVTGTVGLLYALPCGNIASFAREAPEACALLIKEAILQSATPNESLQGITVTGGRLNTNNALLYLMDNCEGCFRPSVLKVTNIEDEKVLLSWAEINVVVNVDLRWREIGNNEWNEILGVEAPYLLTGLNECIEYEFQVKANCLNEQSNYSDIKLFKTDGCCEAPQEAFILNIGETDVELGWQHVLAATSYIVQIRETGAINWDNLLAFETSYFIEELESCMQYEYRVETKCGVESGGFTSIQSFRTHDCGTCADMEYCIPVLNEPDADWLEHFVFGEINHMSGNDGGYGDFSLLDNFVFEKGQTYPMSILPGYGGFAYSEDAVIWLDWNTNGIFEEAEIIFSATTTFNELLETTITIPSNITPGKMRLRVAMMFTNQPEEVPSPCPIGIGTEFGELEDYCITVLEAQNCIPTTTVDTLEVGFNSVVLNWTPVSITSNYTVSYRKMGEENFVTINTFNTNLFIFELDECRTYEVFISSHCSNSTVAESQSLFFDTDCNVSGSEVIGFINWNFFPNPFDDFVTIQVNTLNGFQKANLTIYNLYGQETYTREINLIEGTNVVKIISKDWASGVYFVRLNFDDGQQWSIRKVIKN